LPFKKKNAKNTTKIPIITTWDNLPSPLSK
jgi:hypothetical protein